MNEQPRRFDLNVEDVLESWETSHAIREIIANALDEQLLTSSESPEIYSSSPGRWHVRDYGRGLQYHHLTQNEDQEKLANPYVIGRFGVGLKDALAVLFRRGVTVSAISAAGDISLERTAKAGFGDVVTLHAVVAPSSQPEMRGTEFILDGCAAEDVMRAKQLFIRYSNQRLLASTKYGEVYEPEQGRASVFINGVLCAQEDNFLFSYNITSLTASIKKSLNRERTNVGRSAYTDRVKSILLACNDSAVAQRIADEIGSFETGTMKDELQWADVGVHACKLLNATGEVVFLTSEEERENPDIAAKAHADGLKVVTVPANLKSRLVGQKDYSGRPIRDSRTFLREWNESFSFDFVEPQALAPEERKILDTQAAIFRLIGGRPRAVRAVRVSTSMRLTESGGEAVGVWNPKDGVIIVKRSQLARMEQFAATLLHEVAHALCGAGDLTDAFEDTLTQLLGRISAAQIPEERRRRWFGRHRLGA